MRHTVVTGQLLRQHRAALDAEADERLAREAGARQAEARAGADAKANRLLALAVTLARRAAPWRPAPPEPAARTPA
jgi:hypothetical protein